MMLPVQGTEERGTQGDLGNGSPVAADGPLSLECQAFLDTVQDLQLVSHAALKRFLEEKGERPAEYATPAALGTALVEAKLLTAYQANRVLSGTLHGLALGNYRVLERLGAGGMGIVFLAEHALLKRRAAVKVLRVDEDCPPALLERFYAEARVQADLHHPHIVLAYDAGEVPAPGPGMPHLLYLAMELVTGGDLEQFVLDNGPRPVEQACDWIRQAACGLQEAHDHHLIHRDIKPSNLLLTARGQVKLVDFGLVRQFCGSLTDPRALIGSVEFMSPEQSHDPSAVGAAADIYGLGATLFWLLTGQAPYPAQRVVSKAVRALQQEPPRPLRSLRPDSPAELEALLERLLARNPAARPALPLTIMNELTPFALGGAPQTVQAVPEGGAGTLAEAAPRGVSRQVLIVDDQPAIRALSRASVEGLGCACAEVNDGEAALDLLYHHAFDLVLSCEELDYLAPLPGRKSAA
jgi:tRNA A-37 threonylcarbamoyl transferase component Bud32